MEKIKAKVMSESDKHGKESQRVIFTRVNEPDIAHKIYAYVIKMVTQQVSYDLTALLQDRGYSFFITYEEADFMDPKSRGKLKTVVQHRPTDQEPITVGNKPQDECVKLRDNAFAWLHERDIQELLGKAAPILEDDCEGMALKLYNFIKDKLASNRKWRKNRTDLRESL